MYTYLLYRENWWPNQNAENMYYMYVCMCLNFSLVHNFCLGYCRLLFSCAYISIYIYVCMYVARGYWLWFQFNCGFLRKVSMKLFCFALFCFGFALFVTYIYTYVQICVQMFCFRRLLLKMHEFLSPFVSVWLQEEIENLLNTFTCI